MAAESSTFASTPPPTSDYAFMTAHIINGPQSIRYLLPFFVCWSALIFTHTAPPQRTFYDWCTFGGLVITFFVLALPQPYWEMGNYDVPLFFIGLWFTYLILLKRPER